MNVIWIVSDTFRQDHIKAYGKRDINTPSLDTLAARSVRFNRHYAAGFPTMPTRADHATGKWTMSFMSWHPLPMNVTTLAETLAGRDFTVTTVPFADPGDPVMSVDNRLRRLANANVTTVTTDEWSLLFSPDDNRSELYNLRADPGQTNNIISSRIDVARNIHKRLVGFLYETDVPPALIQNRLELRV